jgi:hypothetical protein
MASRKKKYMGIEKDKRRKKKIEAVFINFSLP